MKYELLIEAKALLTFTDDEFDTIDQALKGNNEFKWDVEAGFWRSAVRWRTIFMATDHEFTFRQIDTICKALELRGMFNKSDEERETISKLFINLTRICQRMNEEYVNFKKTQTTIEL